LLTEEAIKGLLMLVEVTFLVECKDKTYLVSDALVKFPCTSLAVDV
jgi:hypothetical protein